MWSDGGSNVEELLKLELESSRELTSKVHGSYEFEAL